MRRSISLFLSLVLILTFASGLVANGLSLNSIGPKSLGMGGAFIGLADDATAVYWNPAGLANQGNSFELFVTDIIPFANYEYSAYGIEAETEPNHYIGPNFFMNYRLDKLALGFGVYVPAGLGAEWDGDDLVAFSGPAVIDLGVVTVPNPYAGKTFEWMSKIGVVNFGPAVAYKVHDKVSIGAAMNAYYGMVELKRAEDMVNILAAYGVPHDGMMDTQTAFDISGLGYGATIGIQWECIALDKLNFGLTYRTPINIAFEGDVDIDLDMTGDGVSDIGKKDATMDIEWPMWVGFGASYQACEKMLFTFDVQYSNWKNLDHLVAEIEEMPDGTGGTVTQEQEMHLEWDDAVQIRIGVERKINDNLALRAGYYYDPAPAPDETLSILFPSSTNHVITGGAEYVMDKISFNFGIEYLLGEEREIDRSPIDTALEATNMVGKHQMDIFAFSFSAGYDF